MPVCPEQLGGLTTPRERAEIQKSGKVLTERGRDVTNNFRHGAKETIKVAKDLKIKEAILKAKSPSCGSGLIKDGSFSGRLIEGDGITAALLKQNGIRVYTELEEWL